MGVTQWSKSPSENQTADPDINWIEGQAANTVNNSARAMMAAIAEWRDDNAGTLVAAKGTGNSYSVTTNSGIPDLTKSFSLAFTASAANTGAVTLFVDGLPGREVKTAAAAALAANDVTVGPIYRVTYLPAPVDAYLLDGPDAVLRSGGAFTGGISAPLLTAPQILLTDSGNGTNIKIGDDAYIGDANIANGVLLKGFSDPTKGFVKFGNSQVFGFDGANLTYGGSLVYTAGNLTNLARTSSPNNFAADQEIGPKIDPSLWLHYSGVKRARWFVASDGSLRWQDQTGQDHFKIEVNGAVWTQQFGDLSARIESRAEAQATAKAGAAQAAAYAAAAGRMDAAFVTGLRTTDAGFTTVSMANGAQGWAPGSAVMWGTELNAGVALVTNRYRYIQYFIPSQGWVTM